MNKASFEKLIKKDISDKTFNLYLCLYNSFLEHLDLDDSKKSLESFIKVLNIKNISQDSELKQRRINARKQLPKLEKMLKELNRKKSDIEQTIEWLNKQGSTLTNSYRYEKLKITREIKNITSEIRKIKNSII